MTDSLRRIFIAFLAAFAVLAARLIIAGILQAPDLSAHPRNPRLAEARRDIVRGGIYLSGGELVARDSAPGGPRLYAGPPGLAHLIGYEDARYGTAGLEASYNSELLGLGGESLLARIARDVFSRGGKRGNDIILTVDATVQRAAERAMAGRRGAACALDPRTGAVLAMVSNPGFAPERIASQWESLVKDETSPLFNRATLGLYPPGSAVKPLIAAIALSCGAVGADEVFRCEGAIGVGVRDDDDRKVACPDGTAHGDVDLASAIALSCNVAFAQIGWRAGSEKLYNGLRGFHVATALPFDVPTAAGTITAGAPALDRASVAQVSIGQGALAVSPLQMACAIAAIGNGGVMRRPHVVREVRSPDGTPLRRVTGAILGVPASASSARLVAEMMVEAVSRGTARAAALPGVRVAGKTGTAQNPHGEPHAWFVGFAPAEKPRCAVAVVIENGGSGGRVAAPVGREILRAALGSSWR
ncbi:MAG: penicillin-binding transpeptidase domain-containing protein [Firmicutes bacterium]|nr:penicillin-binding transpeptidase domain-containing protein [Bacillota bacterium]MDH7496504.1 penicillin-binding transpeptidase domain-containing protein [Bacillota bacterium]